MREIEFRMWSSDRNGYFYDTRIVLECLINQKLGHIDYVKEGYAFEQFTGLCDAKGNKLFEGDLMKWTSTDTDGSLMTQTDEIKWSKYGWICGKDLQCLADYLCFDPSYENLELIGNIHEVKNEATM